MLGAPFALRVLLAPLDGWVEPARDLLTRARTAYEDGQRGALVRAFLELHTLVVPKIDAIVEKQVAAQTTDERPTSCCIGLLGLWDDLPDLDIEREHPLEVLATHAADLSLLEPTTSPIFVAQHPTDLLAQTEWLATALGEREWPVTKWWRRCSRRARGPLGDRARIMVSRTETSADGSTSVVRVLSHLPDPESVQLGLPNATTDLGEFWTGDELSLAVQIPLPGQLAIFHAVGSSDSAELEVVLPDRPSEVVVRRQSEVVEICGTLAEKKLGDGTVAEQALVAVWVPEVMPPSWIADMEQRKGVPPEARIWRYRYRVVERVRDGFVASVQNPD